MDKNKFDTMTLEEQLQYINNRLAQGGSMRGISTDLGIHKNTIPSMLTKNGYVLDKIAKQYILDISQNNQPVNKPIPVSSQQDKPMFSIPTKTKIKAKTKAFNLIMKEDLTNQLDELAKEKGYSRNELINYICNFFVDNMK